ncbi:MAG: FAD-dependent monooxygenase [Chloroflexi bacterium]|nr:FAD-dependent monooxygenase [Chloroflexota bacterium]MCL5075599.1 FAD-dependent monooxygenase [Chloroflexota bacterium]
MSGNLGPLQDGQTVVIIGGGPAGTSCGLTLMRLAKEKGRSIRVILFEPKDFTTEGNVCVGVLSPPFQTLLGELGLQLFPEMIQRQISGYMLQTAHQTLYLPQDPAEGEPTLVVDRGGFDAFLLESTKAQGVTVYDDTVVDLRAAADGVLVISSGGLRIIADVVVGAFGLDRYALSIFESEVGFQRPGATKSILTEIPLSPEIIDKQLNNTMHAILQTPQPRIEFGALTPKRTSVAINIAGDDIEEADMQHFLIFLKDMGLLANVSSALPFQYASFPSRPARNFYRDRVVSIGDTSGLLRPLKGKGINVGIEMGIKAAQTMMEVGISKQAFDSFYRSCRDLTGEYYYGVGLRNLFRLSKWLECLDPVLELARREPLLRQAFYDMVAGESSYKDIVHRSARLSLLAKIIMAVARDQWERHPLYRRPAA